LLENAQNVPDIAPSVLEDKLVQLNYNSIAFVCRCTPESVKNLLARAKEDIMDLVRNRNLAVNLNFMVGQLNLSAQGVVEFKSGNANLDNMSTYTSMIPNDMRSNVSNGIERSVRGMQAE
jgi:hypothetical protein